MKKKNKISIEITTEEKVNRDFIAHWKTAEKSQSNTTHAPTEKLYFLDAATLLAVLSNQRLALLQALHHHGECSIRALSKMLHRNYKNVFEDVQLLKNSGLIEDNEAREIYVPWDAIQTEINLAA